MVDIIVTAVGAVSAIVALLYAMAYYDGKAVARYDAMRKGAANDCR